MLRNQDSTQDIYSPTPASNEHDQPYPSWFAGLTGGSLALFAFTGLTAQANVNKPSKTGLRPANH